MAETKARTTAEVADALASKVDFSTPANAQAGTSYTFVADDAQRITTSSNAGAVTFTIPPQSSVAWANNTILRVVNYGAGDVTIDGGSGVTVTNTATTLAQFQSAAAIRTGSDAWTLVPFGGGKGFKANGGNEIRLIGNYIYHLFTTNGTFQIESGKNDVQVICVGGGAGGGRGTGTGGGGAGAIEPASGYAIQSLGSGTYSVTVGAGSSGATSANVNPSNGGDSSFAGSSTITALGGGFGASAGTGGTGGSGGGNGGSASGSNTNVGGLRNVNYGGGGGGGATAAGGNGSGGSGSIGAVAGSGGQGKLLTDVDANLTAANFTAFSGMTRISSGGGGGAWEGTGGVGGTGAGNGVGSASTAGSATSFGSGGGGSGRTGSATGNGGAGKSGIVIVRYER